MRVPVQRTARENAASHGEQALIHELRVRATAGIAALARPGLRLGIGDDCALLRVRPGEEIAITTDLSIAGRHFNLDWHPPESVGHRTLARGLSDLAAMGARPVAAFLSLGLPRELAMRTSRRDSSTWMSRFLDGLLALAQQHQVPLAGGDLAESPVAVADIVLAGAVPQGRALLRSSARSGDVLYVTGRLGGSAAALARLEELASKSKGPLKTKVLDATGDLAPHLYPQPRVVQGLWLQRRSVASAAIDLSDGLSTDLNHLCEESGVTAEVDAVRLPISPGATLEQALNGGEDYELLFAARPGKRLPKSIAGVPVTRIGRIVRARAGRPTVSLLTGNDAQPLVPRGWQHFS